MRANHFVFVHGNQNKLVLISHLKEYTNAYTCRCLQKVKTVGKVCLKFEQAKRARKKSLFIYKINSIHFVAFYH